MAIIRCFLNFPVRILQRSSVFSKNSKENFEQKSEQNSVPKSTLSKLILFFRIFIQSNCTTSSCLPRTIMNWRKKNEKSERKKPKFTKFLLNNCYLYIVYLLKLVSLELYHIGVIAFLFPTDTYFYFKNFSCTSVLSK